MNAVIYLDVPDWQIGQDVSIFFPDTMVKHCKCELLKELEAVEKNKECYEDKTAVECLNAIQTLNKYIDDEEDECGCTYWKDKNGYAFKADTGYFFEGLDDFEAYLIKRLRKAVK